MEATNGWRNVRRLRRNYESLGQEKAVPRLPERLRASDDSQERRAVRSEVRQGLEGGRLAGARGGRHARAAEACRRHGKGGGSWRTTREEHRRRNLRVMRVRLSSCRRPNPS